MSHDPKHIPFVVSLCHAYTSIHCDQSV